MMDGNGAAVTERKVVYGGGLVNESGSVRGPKCCEQPMERVGDCGQGCCTDYDCPQCGKKVRIEWPD